MFTSINQALSPAQNNTVLVLEKEPPAGISIADDDDNPYYQIIVSKWL